MDYEKIKKAMGKKLVPFTWSWTEEVEGDGKNIEHQEEWHIGSLGTEYLADIMGLTETLGPIYKKIETRKKELKKERVFEDSKEYIEEIEELNKQAGMAFVKKENIKILNDLIYATLNKYVPDAPEEVKDGVVIENFMVLSSMVLELNTPEGNTTPNAVENKIMAIRNRNKA